MIFIALELATVLALAPGTVEWGQLAYGFALLGAVLAVMVMADPWPRQPSEGSFSRGKVTLDWS